MASQRSRRVTLPGAADLFFTSTSAPSRTPSEPVPPARPADDAAVDAPGEASAEAATTASVAADSSPEQNSPKQKRRGKAATTAPQPSGRQRHDEKITVYISAPELLALEQTRLALRAEYGLTADRGRIVREAVAVLLADFEEYGESSRLVQRLADE
ncbi:hypothetical protein [Salinactinospora qingdaonensis]|uniref:Cobyrinic acid a,c-diamide synthase n=1 Tax=Salinactinospora qingdaonensis TaxID=702744 RepID=A0ABP7FR50_9ACTN